MPLPRPPHGFEAVDQDMNAAALVSCLDVQASDPLHQAVTRQVFCRLGVQPGARVLDVGCGTGGDARLLAPLVAPGGQVVGIDLSAAMLVQAQARARNSALAVVFQRGDGSQIGFADGTFDACYAIRTFQHLADPRQVLAEMIRVVRRSGRLAIADPDHQTTVVDIGENETERELARRFLRWRSDTICSGWIARHLPALAKDLGLVDVRVTPLVNLRTDYTVVDRVSHYEGGVQRAQADGLFTADEAERLVAALRAADATGQFLDATTLFVTSGANP